jgi:hypothetical protein
MPAHAVRRFDVRARAHSAEGEVRMRFLGEDWFSAAATIQGRFGPVVVRPDHIKDDRRARQYIAQVIGMLHALEATRTGNAVLTTVRFYNKPVIVVPFDGQGGACNAWAKKDWGLFTGRVSFTPILPGDRAHAECFDADGSHGAGTSPFEMLIHEMTHIVRAVSGNWLKLDRDDEEELALMVTNIFSVETNRKPLVDYERGEPIGDSVALSDFSRDYYDLNQEMIAAFCTQNADLAGKLAEVKTRFNPVRRYFDTTRPPARPAR